MQMAIFAAFLFTYPLLLQLSFDYTAIETGLALMPFSIAVLIASMLGARLAAKYTAKRLIQAEPDVYTGRGLATAGLVIGIIDLVGWAFVLFANMAAM